MQDRFAFYIISQYEKPCYLGFFIKNSCQFERCFKDLSCTRKKPIEISTFIKEFSPYHTADLFYTKEKRDKFVRFITKKLNEIGIKDVITLSLDYVKGSKKIWHPFAAYTAFHRLTTVSYTHLTLPTTPYV